MTKKIIIITSASIVSLLILSACGWDSAAWNGKWEAGYRGEQFEEPRTASAALKKVISSIAPKKGPVLERLSTQTSEIILPEIGEPLVPRGLPALRVSKKIHLPPQLRPDFATYIPSLFTDESKIEIMKEKDAAPMAQAVSRAGPLTTKPTTEPTFESEVREIVRTKAVSSPIIESLEKTLTGYK